MRSVIYLNSSFIQLFYFPYFFPLKTKKANPKGFALIIKSLSL